VSEHFLIFKFQNAGSIAVARGGEGVIPRAPLSQKNYLVQTKTVRLRQADANSRVCGVVCAVTLPEQPGLRLSTAVTPCHAFRA